MRDSIELISSLRRGTEPRLATDLHILCPEVTRRNLSRCNGFWNRVAHRGVSVRGQVPGSAAWEFNGGA